MGVLLDYTVRVVAVGAAVLGATAGALGCFAVLRRQSLLGDALSHAALPGICMAFLLTGSKAPTAMVLGAGLAGWIGTLAVRAIVRHSRVPFDSALGIVLAVFFGCGLVLLTYIQKRPDASQAGLESFLFGQAAAVLRHEVVLMSVLASLALLTTVASWRHFKLLSFDPDFAASLGMPVRRVDGALTLLLVIAIVTGLQTVGVVLMSAMLVAPAAAARQWTRRLETMVPLAAVFGMVAGVAGAILSSVIPRLPTGPTIILVLSVFTILSLLFAPHRGLVAGALRMRKARKAPRLEPVLMHLFALSLQHRDDPEHGHSVGVVKTLSPAGFDVIGALERLERRGLARQVGEGLWALTRIGRREAVEVLAREDAEEAV